MRRSVSIDSRSIGPGNPCYIIAEIGAMYEDIEGMLNLIKIAGDAGADAVKLQTYKADTMAHPDAEFEFEDGTRISQYEFFKTYEISEKDHRRMFAYAAELGITLFSTPSDCADVDFLDSLGIPAFKTGSDDLTNYTFLEYIARKGRPVVISTGMCTMGEVEEAVNAVYKTGNDQVVLLHCTVSYPSAPEYANLGVIKTMQQVFDTPVGLSCHVPGLLAPALSVAVGAEALEVHVTLDRNLKRPDYQVSLEPAELKTLVDQIRLVPVLLGSGRKKITDTEIKWRRNARKSLVMACDKKKGDMLHAEDIKIMRPGTGIHPREYPMVVGRVLKKDVKANHLLCLEDF